MSDRSIELCGVALRGPVLNGSGTFDAIAARRAFGDALIERFPFDAFVSKTITLAPRQGNPPPRLWETPGGLINSIGLPNKGLDGFLDSDLPELARLPVPLIVSVMGFSRDELAILVAAAGQRDEVAMLELNVSCPNVETGLVMGADPGETALAVERVRTETGKPIIVKLTPNAADPAAVAAAAQAAGANAVSLVNTLKGMALHPKTREPWLGGRSGGRLGASHPRDRPRAGRGGRPPGRNPRDRHGRHRHGPARGRFPRRGRVGGRRGHRELPRPGRGAADRGRARGPVPHRRASRPSVDNRLSPFGGHRVGFSPQNAGTFHARACERSNLSDQKPCKPAEKTLKEPEPASS